MTRALVKGHQPESSIKSAVRRYLQWNGWFCFPIQQSALSYRGLPDLFAVKDGTVYAIECKTATGKLSGYQEQFRDDWQGKGGVYIVAKCIEDVEGLH